MNGLSLNRTLPRPSYDDPFVDHSTQASSFALRATAADYAPTKGTSPASAAARSFAPSSVSPSKTALLSHSARSTAVLGANLVSADATRYVKIAGPPEDEMGMTRIKDVS